MTADPPEVFSAPTGGAPAEVSAAWKRIELARHWLRVDRPERALEELGRLPGDEAMSLPACVIRCAALLATERYEPARTAATQALRLHGPQAGLYRCLAAAHLGLDELSESERAVLAGLAMDPEDPDLLCQYAQLCLMVGQVKKAGALLDRAAAAAPDSQEVMAVRALLATAKGRTAEAYRQAREALGRDPDDHQARLVHSIAATAHGRLREARGSSDRLAAETGDPDLIAMAREDRVLAHPLLLPLWPIVRFGPLRTWLVAVATLVLLVQVWPSATGAVAIGWLAYCVYSWVAPPLVRRYLAWRSGV